MCQMPIFDTPMDSKTVPIDIVVAWVDGADPILHKKRMSYLNLDNGAHPGASATRFHSLNEVHFCVLSILKFAPFVRNIFVVTDQQDPKIHDTIKEYFPSRISDIRIVDHTEIFEGFESYLPTFNSICISNMLWRIKGLSDQFVYFNDDIFLTRPLNPEDWFKNGRPVLRGKWVLPPYERLLWDEIKAGFQKLFLKQKKERVSSFQVNQWNAARRLGFKYRYFRSGHTPLALNRQTLKAFFEAYPYILKENIKHRFRNYEQFNTVALANHLEYNIGNRNFASSQAVYMQPHNRGDGYVNRKFMECEHDKNILFLCVQSLDLATKKDQEYVLKRMNELLETQL